jgi:hypothetical protein
VAQSSTIAGGRTNQANAIVSADQDTIIGDGTTEDPLRAGTGATSRPVVVTGSGALPKGTPVRPNGITAGVVTTSEANGLSSAATIGLLVTPVVDASDRASSAQYAGIFEMTTGEWDAVTGDTGGLSLGVLYYVSATSTGKISSTRTGVSNQCITLLGIAISVTELQLQICGPIVVP